MGRVVTGSIDESLLVLVWNIAERELHRSG